MAKESRVSDQTLEAEGIRASEEFLRPIAHAPARRPPIDLLPGTTWGPAKRYRLERKLGHGGMGIVYLARDTVLDRLVALKLLNVEARPAGPKAKARLVAEARIAAGIEHEKIARIYDVGEHDGAVFVAMEYVRGMTLRQWIASAGSTRVAQVLPLAQQIAQGLAVLHAANIIHRDLKPENVMLTEGGAVKLLDFGLARQLATLEQEPVTEESHPERTWRMAFSGTPGYMAPEQFSNAPFDARVDVFAFGVMLYELLSGYRPFRGQHLAEVLAATIRNRPDFDAEAWTEVPLAVRQLVERSLSGEPSDRIADGSALVAALQDACRPTTSPSPPPSPPLPSLPSLEPAPSIAVTAVPVRRWFAPTRARVLGAAVVVLAGAAALSIGRTARRRSLAPPGMAWIDAGKITVGRTPVENERECAELGTACDPRLLARETPAAEVTLSPFLLDTHEVTNQEFADTLNDLRSQLYVVDDEDSHKPRYVRFQNDIGQSKDVLVDLYPGSGIEVLRKYDRAGHLVDERYSAIKGRERFPAVQVSWYAAQVFCGTRGKRLPTEDQWEAAARGHANRRYPWSPQPVRPGGVIVPRDGWILADPSVPAEVSAAEVGSAFQDVTPEGIHDLGGNVSEWTDSVYVEGDRTGTAGTGDGVLPKVIRGGSWAHSGMARSTARNRRLPISVGVNVGFRCAISHD